SKHDAAYLGQLFARHGAKRAFATIEENVRHVDDEAARGVASLENGVELLQQPGTEFLAFALRLLELLLGFRRGRCVGGAVALRLSLRGLLLLKSSRLCLPFLAVSLITGAKRI